MSCGEQSLLQTQSPRHLSTLENSYRLVLEKQSFWKLQESPWSRGNASLLNHLLRIFCSHFFFFNFPNFGAFSHFKNMFAHVQTACPSPNKNGRINTLGTLKSFSLVGLRNCIYLNCCHFKCSEKHTSWYNYQNSILEWLD